MTLEESLRRQQLFANKMYLLEHPPGLHALDSLVSVLENSTLQVNISSISHACLEFADTLSKIEGLVNTHYLADALENIVENYSTVEISEQAIYSLASLVEPAAIDQLAIDITATASQIAHSTKEHKSPLAQVESIDELSAKESETFCEQAIDTIFANDKSRKETVLSEFRQKTLSEKLKTCGKIITFVTEVISCVIAMYSCAQPQQTTTYNITNNTYIVQKSSDIPHENPYESKPCDYSGQQQPN